MLSTLALVPLVLPLAAQDGAPAPQAPAPELLEHAALSARIDALAAAHSELCSTFLVGSSRAGRALTGLRLAGGELGPGRPAMLVVGNVDGAETFSSALVLWLAERLLDGYADDDGVRALLDGTTLYLIPRANPDAAEARFEAPLFELAATGHGVDDDRDGRLGEDPPSDVDGDGAITWMRVSDPQGTWIPDPTDPRAAVEADSAKGERGSFRVVLEGRDLDGDEAVAEDAPRGADVNRNFSSGWAEHDGASGLFPMDEPEARALADFVIAHRDLALVVTYGSLDNLVEAPEKVKVGAPAVKRVPAPGWIEPDAELLAELGRRRKELTEHGAKGTGEHDGSFAQWAYDHRGLVSVAIDPWDIPLDTPLGGSEESEQATEDEAEEKDAPEEQDAPEPSDDAKRLAWCDANEASSRFKPWTAFEHPELGPVEIGGWMPYARIEPPEDVAREIAAGELAFLVALGELLARPELVEAQARELAGGLIEVEAVIENPALLPMLNASARRTRTTRAARVELLLPEGATLVAGRSEELVSTLSGTGGRHELRWLVTGANVTSVGIRVDTDHAGRIEQTLEVQR